MTKGVKAKSCCSNSGRFQLLLLLSLKFKQRSLDKMIKNYELLTARTTVFDG